MKISMKILMTMIRCYIVNLNNQYSLRIKKNRCQINSNHLKPNKDHSNSIIFNYKIWNSKREIFRIEKQANNLNKINSNMIKVVI